MESWKSMKQPLQYKQQNIPEISHYTVHTVPLTGISKTSHSPTVPDTLHRNPKDQPLLQSKEINGILLQ